MARTQLLELEDPRWVDLVSRHPEATAFHMPAWARLVADCYGFRAFAIGVTRGNHLVGGLPVVDVRQPFGRRKWVSLPFTDHCPPLVDALSSGAIADIAPPSGVRRLQVRAVVEHAEHDPVAVRHVMPIAGPIEEVVSRFHPSQVQRNIRRATREGVTVRVGDAERDLTETFYRLHLITRRRQGVPVQPRRFFALVWQHMIASGHGTVLVAEHAGAPVAAAVFLRHNGTVIYKWGASDADAWAVRPNHALFDKAIRDANAAGDTWFDWGRTDLDNDGLRAFKAAWGGIETPLVHSSIGGGTARAAAAPHDVTESAAGRLAAAVIRRSPAWVCTAAGEALYRYTA